MNELEIVINILKSGGVIAAPTDTVYGLLADSMNDSAVKKVYELKSRPLNKPLLILVSSMEMAKKAAFFSDDAERISYHFWNTNKKPLTVILKAKKVSELVRAGQGTIAIRLPNHKLLLNLINGLSKPIVAPSANISGMEPGTSYEMVKNTFGDKVPLIIDGGICTACTASTIVDLSIKPYKIVREGSISRQELLEIYKKSSTIDLFRNKK